MVHKIALPVLAFAGAAIAACPFSVEITGAKNHVAQVAVTNTGAEAVTVFKGNTVFSSHATKDLLVTAGMPLSLPSQHVHANAQQMGLLFHSRVSLSITERLALHPTCSRSSPQERLSRHQSTQPRVTSLVASPKQRSLPSRDSNTSLDLLLQPLRTTCCSVRVRLQAP